MTTKSKTVKLKPARKGMQVDKPGFGKLHQLGEEVPWDDYWRRRYRQGRVQFVDPADMDGLDVPESVLDLRQGDALKAAKARVSLLEEKLLQAQDELEALQKAAKPPKKPAAPKSTKATQTTGKGETK